MSGGRRYKFQGSTIGVLTNYTGSSPSPSITGITNTSPAVVTSVAHGLSDGDVIRVQDVVGMTEVNGLSFIVDSLTSDTFALYGINATAYGTYASGGHFDKGVFSNFCELTAYNRTGGSSPEIDATTICSDAKEYELGLSDPGSTQISYNFAPLTTIQVAVKAFDASKAITAVQIVLPNGGGQRTQLSIVQQMNEQASVGGLWTASLTLKNTGPSLDVVHA